MSDLRMLALVSYYSIQVYRLAVEPARERRTNVWREATSPAWGHGRMGDYEAFV
jgi:hypothetical protein